MKVFYKKAYLFCLIFFFSTVILAAKTYIGTVVPLVKDKIPAGADADYWGYLKFTAKWGQIIKPEIKNINGEVVEKGTALTQMTKEYWIDNVDAAKDDLTAAEHAMKVAYENLKRYEELYPTGATSVQLYQSIRANYYEAYGVYQAAKANLYEKQRDLEECVHVAPFEGIVDKVYFSNGILVPNPDVIEISMLNPIGIQISMDINEACNIQTDTKIAIYFDDEEEPVGIYNGLSFLNDDGIIFVTRNYPEENSEENLIKVQDCFPVVNFYIGKTERNQLGVPLGAIAEDDKGFFVWRAVNGKMLQPGQGLDPVFNVEKVYVVPGILKRLYYGCDEIRILKDSGKLKLHDVVVSAPPENLSDGGESKLPSCKVYVDAWRSG